MLINNKQRSADQKGFTIIEVLIVLAIVGLIMLIVFLAVPALQRSSRNTQIKNDVQNVVGGVSEFQNANNGVLPSSVQTAAATPGQVDYTRNGGNATSIKINGSTTVSSSTAAPTAATPNLGTIAVSLGYRCDGTASPRAIAAVFTIETTSNKVRQCQDS